MIRVVFNLYCKGLIDSFIACREARLSPDIFNYHNFKTITDGGSYFIFMSFGSSIPFDSFRHIGGNVCTIFFQ